ncbi:MAG: DUF2799 domain-containing protein [Pseudomonadota bacterium]
MSWIKAMTFRGICIPTIVCMLLSACANHSGRLACETGNWSAWGYEDGAAGLDRSAFKKRKDPCKSEQIDESAYVAGWNRGIVYYCKPEKGFEAGLSDEKYRDVCQGKAEEVFLAEYRLGQRYLKMAETRDLLTEQASEARSSLSRHRNGIRMARKRYENPNLSGDERYSARLNLDYHQREIDGLLVRMPKLQAKRKETIEALEAMEADLVSSGRINSETKIPSRK